MAADTELVKVDYIDKETWDTLLNGGGASGLPEVTAADNGKVLKVADGEWDKGNETSYAPLACTGTIDQTGETPTMTLDKTAAEVYEAVASGLGVVVTASVATDVVTTFVPYVAANRNVGEADTKYDIRLTLADGTMLFCEELAANDTVVLAMQSG